MEHTNIGADKDPEIKKCEDDPMEGVSIGHATQSVDDLRLYRTISFRPKPINFDDIWKKIQNVIDIVMTSQPSSRKLWDDCFFDVYALCTVSHVQKLYAHLTEHFINRVDLLKTKLEEKQGIDFIQAYSVHWLNYNEGVKHVHDLCGYLNRMIKREANWKVFEQDYSELCSILGGLAVHVSEMSRIIWQKFLLLPLKDNLFSIIWEEFVNTRDNDYNVYPHRSIKTAVESFIDVCFPSDDERDVLTKAVENAAYANSRAPSTERLMFYEEFFECRFLQNTDEYFKNAIGQELSNDLDGMYTYMTKAKKILESEERLCRQSLYGPTVEKTLKLLRIAFVLYQLERFADVIPQYVKLESKKELSLCFNLLSPFTEGVTLLVQEYEKYVRDVLCNQLNARGMTSANFVEIVCYKYQYFYRFTGEVFDHAHTLSDGYRRAIESVVNDERDGEKFFAAKMIARHMDMLLRKATRSSRSFDIEDKMDEAVIVFRFVKDKDAFLKIYQRLFSTRLLSKFTSSMEMESLMIEKLREACGHDYTNKLVRMYTDYENSKQLTEEFYKQHDNCEQKHSREDEFTVIQTCAWPISCSRDDQHMSSFVVPTWISPADCFKKFYEEKYNGRILNFAYHVSTADVGVNVGQRNCTVTMTLPQVVLLLNYQSENQFTIGQLAEGSGLSFETTCNCLKALIDFKILHVKAARSAYTPETSVEINLEFQAQRSRVHLQPPIINSRTQEGNPVPTHRETLQDRKVAVECAIVRAMKTQKVLHHRELIESVLMMTKSRFVPEISFLKTCIEGLIDKHFIQRTDNVDEYEYLS
ncbi:hypothetical protein M3Y94_00366500 [Aphelenchoides besseyi]|nr:hypothetical protein M3Y94_00366500 [Aphelenchoides besseyi]